MVCTLLGSHPSHTLCLIWGQLPGTGPVLLHSPSKQGSAFHKGLQDARRQRASSSCFQKVPTTLWLGFHTIKFRVWTEPFSEFKMDQSTTTLEDHQVVSPCSVVQQRSCIGKDPSHSLHTHKNTMSSTMDQGAKSTLVGSL